MPKAISALLASFGALWLIIEIASFFSDEARSQLKVLWPAFLVLGVVLALWFNRPLQFISCKLSGRDITLSVGVGDIFKSGGALVVGASTTYDTDMSSGLINAKSIQGQFSNKHYDSMDHLDRDIERALENVRSRPASNVKNGKKKAYPIGTVARITPKKQSAYFLAIAEMNSHGVAIGKFEDLKTALPSLWEFIGSAGSIEPIVMPVLGTGFSRIPESREEVIREVINSFVVACSERRFTDSLTIVIHPKDFYRNAVNLPELGRYLSHICRYTEYGASRKGQGTPIYMEKNGKSKGAEEANLA